MAESRTTRRDFATTGTKSKTSTIKGTDVSHTKEKAYAFAGMHAYEDTSGSGKETHKVFYAKTSASRDTYGYVPGKGKAKAEAGLVKINYKNPYVQGSTEAFTVGASGSFTPAKVGGKLSAKVAELKVRDPYGVAEARIGLSGDTEASLGWTGASLKVAGTGAKVSLWPPGVEASVLGTGLRLGWPSSKEPQNQDQE